MLTPTSDGPCQTVDILDVIISFFSCVEARWLSRVSDTAEVPFDKAMSVAAVKDLDAEPAFERSDRIHPLSECRVPQSRNILARRYMQH